MASWRMQRPMFLVRFDLRNPDFAGVSGADRYGAALDMASWADEHGAVAVVLSEHHGSDDGYLPSALTMAAAVAARTSRTQIHVSAIPAAMHDPLQLAEQVAVVEHVSAGRLTVVLTNGYVPSELAMFGVDPSERPARVVEAVAVLRAARTGEPFELRGRTVRVTPAVATPGRAGPPIHLGGSSAGAARRALRIADRFQPSDEATWELYRSMRIGSGRRDPGPFVPDAGFVHLATDVDAGWETIGPYVRHDAESYARWAEEAGIEPSPAYRRTSDDIMADIRARSLQRVLTPAQLVEEISTDPTRPVILNPMIGGLPPDDAWQSLRLFEHDVLGV